MTIFSLEALDALSGDALILHWGESDDERLALVDGGFVATYNDRLSKRLDEIRADRLLDANEPLPIDLAVVSHIDSDHISGMARLFRDMKDRRAEGKDEPYDPLRLWFNSFDDALTATAGAAITPGAAPARSAMAAALKEGRELRNSASVLNRDGNQPFGGLIVTPSSTEIDGLTIVIVGPTAERLKKLQDEWQGIQNRGQVADDASIAAFVDNAVPNLSSIVLHIRFGGHTMLLTGDGRGDDTLAGLAAADLLDAQGRCPIGLLKVPHHGSQHNVTIEYFRSLPADHYVISANGGHGNPDKETLKMIVDSQGDRAYTFHLTHATHAVAFLKKDHTQNDRNYTVRTREPGAHSIAVDLAEALR